MKRRLFTILSALSLLLCVAVLVMWVRSRDYLDSYGRAGLYVASYDGRVHFIRESGQGWILREGRGMSSLWMTNPDVTRNMAEPWQTAWDAGTSKASFLGGRFAYRSLPSIATTVVVVTLPHWMLCVATGLLPVAWTTLHVLRRRKRDGLCPSCGYDLRATPDRCPECGAVTGVQT